MSFNVPATPEPEAAESDSVMVTTSLDPELAEAFSEICGDRARSGVLRYMIAHCLEDAGVEGITAAAYSRIGKTRVKGEVVLDD